MAGSDSPIFSKIVSLFAQSQTSLKRRIILLDLGAIACIAILIGTEILLLQAGFKGKTEVSIMNLLLLGSLFLGILSHRRHTEHRLRTLEMKTDRLKSCMSEHIIENNFIPAYPPQQK
ncbi:MAG: hypothetical protein HGB11_12745 [Chlorobiales bacterium]|nr:hypothetical protein [Chlorobiales bacterium]